MNASARSHYGRRDLELLFELQPRAAQKLLELLPSVPVGTSRLVERETLSGFLDRVQATDDVGRVFEEVRAEKATASHKRLRSLVTRDETAVSLASLPESVSLRPGQLEVNFRTVEELAVAMYWLARVLESEAEAFAQRFEPITGNHSQSGDQ